MLFKKENIVSCNKDVRPGRLNPEITLKTSEKLFKSFKRAIK